MSAPLYIAPLPGIPIPIQQLANDAFRFVAKTMGVSQFRKEPGEGDRGAQPPGLQHALLEIAHLLKTLKIRTGTVSHAILDQFHMRYSAATSFCSYNSTINSIHLAPPTSCLDKAREEVAKRKNTPCIQRQKLHPCARISGKPGMCAPSSTF